MNNYFISFKIVFSDDTVKNFPTRGKYGYTVENFAPFFPTVDSSLKGKQVSIHGNNNDSVWKYRKLTTSVTHILSILSDQITRLVLENDD